MKNNKEIKEKRFVDIKEFDKFYDTEVSRECERVLANYKLKFPLKNKEQ